MPRSISIQRVAASVLVAAVLAAGSALVQASPQQAAEALVKAKARELFAMHRRGIKALQAAAKDPVYRDYFSIEPDRAAAQRDAIEAKSLKLQKHFDIEEMCLIDRSGREIVRLVHGQPSDDLSEDEADNVFFEPAFALPEGDVLVSPVYRSPDTHRWVVAYVTPIAAGGENQALLHYEQDIVQIATELSAELDPDSQVLLAVDEEGRFLFDSRDADALLEGAAGGELPRQWEGREFAVIEGLIAEGRPIGEHAGASQKLRGWTLVALQR